MHRDYSDPTGEVFIGIYPDRIEITNRGKLTLSDKQLKKKHDSIPPNPDITFIIFLDGIIEKVGRGTILITEEFEKLGLKAPRWEGKNGLVTLTLFGTPKEVEFNERMIQFLKTLSEGDSFSREQYQQFFNDGEISERTARNV
jgi:ATP-dependent DNA helicase RecG